MSTSESHGEARSYSWNGSRDFDLTGGGKGRHDIRQWLSKLESDLEGWAKRLSVRDFNHLRSQIDDATHRALHLGFSDVDSSLHPGRLRMPDSDTSDGLPF